MTNSVEYLTASAVFVGTFIIIRMLTNRGNNDGRRHPPSMPSIPILGSLPFLAKPQEFPVFLAKKGDELGNVFSFRLGKHTIVVINKRDAIHEALVKRALDFSDRPDYLRDVQFNPKMSGIIEHAYNAEFRREHQLCISILKEFGFGRGIMETRIQREVDDLVKSLRSLNSRPVNPEKQVTCNLLNVIASILFNTRYRVDDDELEQIMEVVDAFLRHSSDVNIVKFISMFYYLPSIRSCIERNVVFHERLIKIFDKRVKDSLREDAEDSFVRRYVDAQGDNFDHDQLRFIIRDLVIAGTDTGSITIQWAMVMLANNPDIQERLQVDIDSVVPRDRLPSLDDKVSLPFVEAAILELMRWRTLVPLTIPHKTLNDTEVDGYFIPAKTTIFCNLYSAHMDPKVFPDPEEYKPERFLDESGQVINKDLMLSFSLGRRSCLGELLARQEVFLFFSGLLQQFHIRPPEGQRHVNDTPVVSVMTSPSHFEVRFIPRENK